MTKQKVAALVSNILLMILGFIGLIKAFSAYSTNLFVYYTVDSNILCLISNILYVLFFIIKRKQEDFPLFVLIIRFMATICLAVTFIVVVAYLAPSKVWIADGTYFDNLKILLFKDDMLYQHLLCPIVSFISFSFFEGDRRLNKKKTIWMGVIPTLVYGTILIILNTLNVVNGPYPFFRIEENPKFYALVMVGIILLSYLLSKYILLINQINSPKLKRR